VVNAAPVTTALNDGLLGPTSRFDMTSRALLHAAAAAATARRGNSPAHLRAGRMVRVLPDIGLLLGWPTPFGSEFIVAFDRCVPMSEVGGEARGRRPSC